MKGGEDDEDDDKFPKIIGMKLDNEGTIFYLVAKKIWSYGQHNEYNYYMIRWKKFCELVKNVEKGNKICRTKGINLFNNARDHFDVKKKYFDKIMKNEKNYERYYKYLNNNRPLTQSELKKYITIYNSKGVIKKIHEIKQKPTKKEENILAMYSDELKRVQEEIKRINDEELLRNTQNSIEQEKKRKIEEKEDIKKRKDKEKKRAYEEKMSKHQERIKLFNTNPVVNERQLAIKAFQTTGVRIIIEGYINNSLNGEYKITKPCKIKDLNHTIDIGKQGDQSIKDQYEDGEMVSTEKNETYNISIDPEKPLMWKDDDYKAELEKLFKLLDEHNTNIKDKYFTEDKNLYLKEHREDFYDKFYLEYIENFYTNSLKDIIIQDLSHKNLPNKDKIAQSVVDYFSYLNKNLKTIKSDNFLFKMIV